MQVRETRSWKALARLTDGIKLLDSYESSRDLKLLTEAEEQLVSAKQLDPSYRAATFYLGVTREMLGKHDIAAREFENLLASTETQDPELFYNLGIAYFHQYQPVAYEKAVEYLKRAADEARQKLSKDKKETERSYATILLSRSVLAQVYAHMTILADPTPTPAFNERAESYFGLAVEEAGGTLKELRETGKKLSKKIVSEVGWGAHNAHGVALMYKGRRVEEVKQDCLEGAIGEFQKALQYSPDNHRVLSNLGSANLFLGRFAKKQDESKAVSHLQEARLIFDKVLELRPHYDFAYCRLADIYLEMGLDEQAEYYVNMAADHPSEMTPAYLERLRAKIQAYREDKPSSQGENAVVLRAPDIRKLRNLSLLSEEPEESEDSEPENGGPREAGGKE